MAKPFKAAFIFVAPEGAPDMHFSWVETPEVHVKTIAVSNYIQACDLMETLVDEGVAAVELCAGFGNKGVAEVTKAAANRIPVGVVRFDKHPCLGNVSGDDLV